LRISQLIYLSALLFAASVSAAPFQKVMIVVFENTSYDQVVSLPFFGKLAAEGSLFTNFRAEGRPSQPNYIAMIAGDMHGVKSNDNVDLDVLTIADLLERKNRTWKVYAEGFPGNCYQGAYAGAYARKHNPFISIKSIQRDPARCARIVNASELAGDVAQNKIADYSFYIPDQNNDGHDTSPKFADEWYARTFGPLLQNPTFMKGMLLVTTFDEAHPTDGSNRIYTSFYGAGVKAGSVSGARYDHYSLLRTLEAFWGLDSLGYQVPAAKVIDGVWKTNAARVPSSSAEGLSD